MNQPAQDQIAPDYLADLDALDVTDRPYWQNGPPHEIFKELRGRCPVHWSEINEYPNEEGFWSITRADDVHEVSLDWETYSSERGGDHRPHPRDPARADARDVHRPGPAEARPPEDALPARLHPEADRGARGPDPGDHRAVLDGVADSGGCDLVTDVAQPVVSRVIGSFMGIPEEDDAIWARLMNSALGLGDEDLNPGGIDEILEKDIPEIFERCRKMIAERRENPTDDLTSVLVHAEIDGEKLEEHEIVMGFFLLVAAGNDSTKATYTSGMRALLEHPDQMKMLVDDPSLIPGAVEECLRMYPAFAHFRRTATRDTEIAGQPIGEGEKVVMWYVSSNRDETRYEDPDRFDVHRNPEHQAFGAGGRHFCLGAALARLELRILFEETLRRFPEMELAGEARAGGLGLPQPAEDAAGPLARGPA